MHWIALVMIAYVGILAVLFVCDAPAGHFQAARAGDFLMLIGVGLVTVALVGAALFVAESVWLRLLAIFQ